MKKTLPIVVLLASSFFGGAYGPAFGEGLRGDGNELLEACSLAMSGKDKTRVESGKSDFCMGFIRGYVNSVRLYESALVTLGHNNFLCPPIAPVGQYVRVVHKYLQDHPEKLHYDEGVLVFDALKEAFPCPKK
jgi:hypothetical protein